MRGVILCLGLLLIASSDALAQAAPDIAVEPDSADYGVVFVGASRERAFAVTNEGTADLVVFAAEIQGTAADQFQIVSGGGGFLLNPGTTTLVRVRFSPSSPGRKRAVLSLENNDPDENPLVVVLTGTGEALPDIAVNRTVLAYGPVALGTTRLQEVVVSNQGLVDLDVTATAVDGPDADQFSIEAGAAPFVVPPQGRDTIRVAFTPQTNGEKEAILRLTSNDPDESPLELLLVGQGTSPAIASDTTAHDFGEAALGTGVFHTFLISNEGTADLVVDSVDVRGSGADQFRVSDGGPPFLLRLAQLRQLTVQFAPTVEGPHEAMVRLFSNDPKVPQLDLMVRGTALAPALTASAPAFDFGTVLVGLDTTQTLTLKNEGRAELVLSVLAVSGGDSTDFGIDLLRPPVRLAPSDSLLLNVRFRPPTAGSKTSALRLVSNDPQQPEVRLVLSGEAVVLAVQVEEAAPLGADVDVRVPLPPGFAPDDATLFYRAAGETTFRAVPLVAAGPAVQGLIPGLAVTAAGLEYYVELSDGGQTVSVPAGNPQSLPLFLPAQVGQLAAPLTFSAWSYQMIAVPLLLAEQEPAAVLFDDYGPYNTRRWRLFRWEGGDYAEYPDIQGTFAAGSGFWLITNDGTPFDVENGRSTDPSTPFALTLQPGWNQIGNPYAFPVGWPGATIDPRVEAPVAFDGSEFQYGQTTLQPWEGYFVRNNAPIAVTVPLSGRRVASPAEKRGATRAALPRGQGAPYRLRVSAEQVQAGRHDTQNYLGLLDEARLGHDPFDVTEAPPLAEGLRLSIVEHGVQYAGNFKPPAPDGQYWDLEVTGAVPGDPVQITLAATGHPPPGHGLYVVDRDYRYVIPTSEGGFSLAASEDRSVRHLRVLLGTPAYVQAHQEEGAPVPHVFHLAQNYPNPFGPETTIRYQLGDPAAVRLEVYDLVGRRVCTLVDRPQEAGSYAIRWDGRNEAGVAVASGVYLYRLRAGSFTKTQKMLRIR